MSLATLTIALFFASSPPPQASERYAIDSVHVIDGTGRGLLTERVLVIDGETIEAIVAKKDFDRSSVETVVDGQGRFAIPGLWDMHVHFQELDEVQMALFVAWGVTTVRDMGDPPEIAIGRKEAIEDGSLVGPRIFTSVYMIDNSRIMGLIEQLGGPEQMEIEHQRRLIVDTPEQARDAVRRIAEVEADFVKLHWNQSRETYFAIAEEAREQGLRFAGHDPLGVLSLQDWIDAGQHSIDHIDGTFGLKLDAMDKDRRDAMIDAFAQSGLHFVPTLLLVDKISTLTKQEGLEARIEAALDHPQGIYVSDELESFWRFFFGQVPGAFPGMNAFAREIKYLRAFHEAGVKIMPGTDLGVPAVFAGFSLHEELKIFVDLLGMSCEEAIRSATQVPAAFFDVDESLGTIEKGKVADIVLLEANPLETIDNTRRVDAVISRGTYRDRATLDSLMEKAQSR